MAQVGLDLGAAKLGRYFNKFRLGETYCLGLPMSASQWARCPQPRSCLARHWPDRALTLHMAQIFGVFANGGYLPPLHLVKGEGEQTEEEPVLKPETVEMLNSMLADVVREGTGTQARVEGLTVYGKTGTAEVVGRGTHAWFAGHTTLSSEEKIAFALLVEEGGVGGQSAAPDQEFLSRLVQ